VVYYQKERSGIIKDEGLGLIHIYYGEGVGKTTRAVGLALRAAGEGLNVDFVQFMKSGRSGEASMFKKIPNISYRCPGPHPFILSKGPEPVHFQHASKALEYAHDAIVRSTDLLICDEILNTVLFGILPKDSLLELAHECKGKVELVMTGRDAFPQLIEIADYITEFLLRKHPYYRGAKARKGIEY